MCFGNSKEKYLDSTLKQLIPTQIAKQDQALNPLQSNSLDLMNNGSPEVKAAADYSTGTVAKNSAQARAQVIRSQRSSGISTNDPAAQGVMADFEASRARGYDENMMNLLNAQQQAKARGAQQLAGVAAARSPYPALSMYSNLALNG